jgi:DNA-binding GntR family transcriptional regulator
LIKRGNNGWRLAIADELGQFIQSGQLPTGERLPPQRKLAQHLDVTSGTVSHAYAVLEQRGMATARVGDGTYVRSPDAAVVTGHVHSSPGLVDLSHNTQRLRGKHRPCHWQCRKSSPTLLP